MLYFKNFFLRNELSTLRIQVALRVSTGMSLAMTMSKLACLRVEKNKIIQNNVSFSSYTCKQSRGIYKQALLFKFTSNICC